MSANSRFTQVGNDGTCPKHGVHVCACALVNEVSLETSKYFTILKYCINIYNNKQIVINMII